MLHKHKQKTGFTLIELLITVSITLLITGGGIAGFITFNDRQQVQTTVKNIQQLMRAAQVKARAGEGANDCASGGKLKGYRITSDSSFVYLHRLCMNPTSTALRSQVPLDAVSLAQSGTVTFLSLQGGVDTGGSSSITFTVSGQYSGIEYEFQVLNTGEITEGSFL